MIDHLTNLNQVAGVKGSMLVTQDGIVVHALLGVSAILFVRWWGLSR